MFRRAAAAAPALRTVVCYHCARAIEVAALAQTLTCPCCYQRLRVDDVLIEGAVCVPELRTAGSLLVARRGSLRAGAIEAGGGLTVLGTLTGTQARSPRVSIGPRATWRGDCAAVSLDLHPTASILGGRFTIGRWLAGGPGRASPGPSPASGAPPVQIVPMHSPARSIAP